MANQLASYRSQLETLRSFRRELSPGEIVLLIDSLTGEHAPRSKLVEVDGKYYVEISIERISQAIEAFYEANYYQGENQMLTNLIIGLENSLVQLRGINQNLGLQLQNEQDRHQITINQRDLYKNLVDEVRGKTNRTLFITVGIIAVETAIIILLLASGGS